MESCSHERNHGSQFSYWARPATAARRSIAGLFKCIARM